MLMKTFGSLVAVGTFLFGSTAIAQTTDQGFYIQVGSDHNNNPIALDLASVEGTSYILIEQRGNVTAYRTLHANCEQGKLSSKRLALYTSGKLTSDEPMEKETFPQPGTADANSMEIVCQSTSNHGSK